MILTHFLSGESSWAGNETTSLADVAVLCTLNYWERDFPCMWHQTHTCTIQTTVEAVSVPKETTNGESSSDSVSTQECAKSHLRESIISKKFRGGGHAPNPPRERCFRGRWDSPTKRTTLKDFLDPPLPVHKLTFSFV